MKKLHLLNAVRAYYTNKISVSNLGKYISVLVVTFGLLISHASFADSLYGVSLANLEGNAHSRSNPGPSSLYVIDEATGAGTLIGDIGYAVNSIAFDPTAGLMYGATTSWSGDFNGLLLINLSTGAATEIGAFGAGFTSILGLSFNSSGELIGWHDPDADDPVRIDKATGAATTLGPGTGTAQQVLAFDNSDKLILAQGSSVYEINTITGVATLTETLHFDPGHGGADINNITGDLWASATKGRTQDSIIRVTNLATDTFTDIDTDVEYLNALAFSGASFLPGIDVSINVEGGTSQQCDEAGGKYVELAATVDLRGGAVLDSIYWTVDGNAADFGESIMPFLSLGTYSISATASGVSGIYDTASISLNVFDTVRPDLSIEFIDTRTGQAVTSVEGRKTRFIEVRMSGADVCDADVDVSGVVNPVYAVTDGEVIKINNKKQKVDLPTTAIEVTAQQQMIVITNN